MTAQQPPMTARMFLTFAVPFEIVFAVGVYLWFAYVEGDAEAGAIVALASLGLGAVMVGFSAWRMRVKERRMETPP
ncbi:MAG: hypothetical protein ACREHE_13110 [Rhizomicrobium sp.]